VNLLQIPLDLAPFHAAGVQGDDLLGEVVEAVCSFLTSSGSNEESRFLVTSIASLVF
jgi:hypothetical protein